MGSVLAYAVCALVWGTTWFAIRVCIGPGGYPTFAAAALRFSLAAALLAPLLASKRVRPLPRGRAQWAWLIAAGGLNGAAYALVYAGEESVSGGLAAVLFATQPLATALLVTLAGTERVTRAELGGALVALVGIGILFAERLEVSPSQGLGVALILGSVLVASVYSLILKQRLSDVHPFALTALFLGASSLALWGAALCEARPLPSPLPLAPTLALVYLSVFGSVIAFVTYFYLLRAVSLMTVSTLVFFLPVIALLVDAAWEREVRLGARAYLGIGVILAGVAGSSLRRAVAGEPLAGARSA